MTEYRKWVESKTINNTTLQELISIRDNYHEIEDRFYKNLEFGTGGLRGVVGAGTNRVNVYTIRKVTQGIANFINKNSFNRIKSVAIAYDSRHSSYEFAKEAALVYAANDIKAFLFDSLHATPILSFAVRYLQCDAGIVITASHNPPEYNGYKVYGSDGGQITLDLANKVIEEIENLDIFNDVKTCTETEAINSCKLEYIGENIDYNYIEKVTGLSIFPNVSQDVKDFKIVYTPLHGTGFKPIERLLKKLGYKQLFIVESQKNPDGDFPTVKSPNPEEREALSEGINLAKSINADIVLGTDPDSDRVGVAVKDLYGNYQLLSGNQVGALLTNYLIINKKFVSARDVVIKTIVTSELGANIAKKHGVSVLNTLTGFKYIGEKIHEFEKNKDYDFLFGYEESFGYLAGNFVRDKDAIISTMLIVEMAAHYKIQGLTLIDKINELYIEYGYYLDALESFTFKGIEGQNKIQMIVDKFRNIEELKKVFTDLTVFEDYKVQERVILDEDNYEKIELPSSNVIKLHFKDLSWIAIRPSGTEPKLKVYYSSRGDTLDQSNRKLESLKTNVSKLVN